MYNKQQIYQLLNEKNIKYNIYEHHAVYTVEEMEALEIDDIHKINILKNLFLRDDKGKNYYLVSCPKDSKTDLKLLSEKITSRKLSFASEERLMEQISLTKGSVTPLALLNNKNVVGVFDLSLKNKEVGIHPMENTATIFLNFDDLLKLIEDNGNKVVFCDMN